MSCADDGPRYVVQWLRTEWVVMDTDKAVVVSRWGVDRRTARGDAADREAAHEAQLRDAQGYSMQVRGYDGQHE